MAALLSLALVLVLPSCGGNRATPQTGPAPAPKPPEPARAVPPMDLAGMKVLILPVQVSSGVQASREQVTGELVFALGERDQRTQWVTPEQLRSALRRTPGYAGDPGAVPQDDYMHHQERYVVDPLRTVLRRYSALVDARVVLVPREVRWHPAADGQGGFVRMTAAVVDPRTGNVVWFGEADGETRPEADAAATATAAQALAARMVIESGK